MATDAQIAMKGYRWIESAFKQRAGSPRDKEIFKKEEQTKDAFEIFQERFENEYELNDVISILEKTKGVIVKNDNANFDYPMPKDAHNRDEVFVGRIRRDETQPKTLNLWVVADNLRKGAATNAVQIAEYLAEKGILKA